MLISVECSNLFYVLGIEEDFITWKTKLLEFLSNEVGRDGVKSCPCGRDENITGSCCRSHNDNTTGVDHPLTTSEDAEVGIYVVHIWHSTIAQITGLFSGLFQYIVKGERFAGLNFC